GREGSKGGRSRSAGRAAPQQPPRRRPPPPTSRPRARSRRAGVRARHGRTRPTRHVRRRRGSRLTSSRPTTFQGVVIPPFETFYDAHRDEIFRFLHRRLGRDRAEDAFQETFLRALRAYPRLEHGEHLRAWVFTIASRIVVDDVRRRRPDAELPDGLFVEDGLPAFEDLAPLTE